MPQFYFTYSSNSLTNAVNLMDVTHYFVTAHSFKVSAAKQATTLDLILTIQGESTAEMADRAALISNIVRAARDARPPHSHGAPLVLWSRLAGEVEWTIWTVLSGVTAPLDIAVVDGHTYQLHLQLEILPHSIGETYKLTELVTTPAQTVFAANIRGTSPACLNLTVSSTPAGLAGLHIARRGHRTLEQGQFSPHYPVMGELVASEAWQTLGSISSHGQPWDNGLFMLYVAALDTTPFMASVTDLSYAVTSGALAGGFFEYQQTGIDVLGNEGPVSNSMALELGDSPLVYQSPLAGLVGSREARGGGAVQPFRFGIEPPVYYQPGMQFDVASDGWMLHDAISEPLLVPDMIQYGTAPPTNKLPPQPGELGHAFSTTKIALPLPVSKRRSMAITINIATLQLGALGSPVFFPLLGTAGVCFDGLGWKLYLSTADDPTDDWRTDKTIFSAFAGLPLGVDVAVGLEMDWSLGFLRVALVIDGNAKAVLFSSQTPSAASVLLGAYVSNELAQYGHARTEDLDKAHWSYTKVQVLSTSTSDSEDDSESSSLSSSASQSQSSSASQSSSSSSSKGGGGSSSSSQGGGDSSTASSSGSGSDGHSASTSTGSGETTITRSFHDIPITTDGDDSFFQNEQDNLGFSESNPGPTFQWPPVPPGDFEVFQFGDGSEIITPAAVIAHGGSGTWAAQSYQTISVPGASTVVFGDVDTLELGSMNLDVSRGFGGSKSGSVSGSQGASGSGSGSGATSIGTQESVSNSQSQSTSRSQSSSVSDSVSTSSGKSTSTSISTTVVEPLTYDVPVASFTREVIYEGQIVGMTTTKAKSTSASASASESSSTSASMSSSASTSVDQSGQSAHARSESSSSSDSFDASGDQSGSGSSSSSQSGTGSGNASSPGDTSSDGNTDITIDGLDTSADSGDIIDNSPQDGQDPSRGFDNKFFREMLGIPPPHFGTHEVSVPVFRGSGTMVNGVFVLEPNPDLDAVIELDDGQTRVGLPQHSVKVTHESSQQKDTASSTQNSTSNSKSGSSAESRSSSSSDDDSLSVSLAKSGSNSRSQSSSLSESHSNSNSSSQSDSNSLSKQIQDVYKLVPLVSTVLPLDGGVVARTVFSLRNLQIYDGPLPQSNNGVRLAWTPQAGLSSQRIYRRNNSLLDGSWAYRVLNASAASFVDVGDDAWIVGSPPTEWLKPCLFRAVVNGLYTSGTQRIARGGGLLQWVKLGPLPLAPNPRKDAGEEPAPWSVDIQCWGAGTVAISDAYLLPQEESSLDAKGSAPWLLTMDRFGHVGGENKDVTGRLELSPGNNVLVLLGEDVNGSPLNMEGSTIDIDITPMSKWLQT